MPTNKIGALRSGQGLRRILAQRRGGWRAADDAARANYEIGQEWGVPGPGGSYGERYSPNRPSRKGRWARGGEH